MQVDVQVDRRQVRRVERMLQAVPRGAGKVFSRAINKTATAARRKIVDAVAGELAVRKGELKKRNVKLRKASYTRWAAAIQITGKRIPLARFQAKQTRRGVSYRIRRTGGRKTIPHAFLAARHGLQHVWRRAAGGGPSGLVGRMPISPRFGPSVPVAMEGIPAMARQVLDRQIAEQLSVPVGEVELVLNVRRFK